MYEITVSLDGVTQWIVCSEDRMHESDYVELTQTKHSHLGQTYSIFGLPLWRGKGFFLNDVELIPAAEPSNNSTMTVRHRNI